MKRLKMTLVLVALFLTSGLAFGQSNNLRGKAMAAANECMQDFDYHGLGLKIVANVTANPIVGDGCQNYVVEISALGHCPQNNMIACLVIAVPIATVYFDCDENLSGIVCHN